MAYSAFCLYYLDHLPRCGAIHNGLGSPTSVINQENASQTCPLKSDGGSLSRKVLSPQRTSLCHHANWLALLGRRAQLDSSYIISVSLHWKFGKWYTCHAALTHPGIVGVKRNPKVVSFPLPQLEDRVLDWQSSPASSLNSWFSAAPNWAELVLPALQYLAGESRGEVFSIGVHHVFPFLSKELILAVNCSCSFVQ